MHILASPGSSYQAGIYNSAQYYNANNINPNQYALDLLGAINASGVPLIVEAPPLEGEPRMWIGTTVPEVQDGAAYTVTVQCFNNLRMVCVAACSSQPLSDSDHKHYHV